LSLSQNCVIDVAIDLMNINEVSITHPAGFLINHVYILPHYLSLFESTNLYLFVFIYLSAFCYCPVLSTHHCVTDKYVFL